MQSQKNYNIAEISDFDVEILEDSGALLAPFAAQKNLAR
jgi:hypothetical protein